MTISPKVKLIFADGTKQKIELYKRPPMLDLNLTLKDGKVLKGLHFIRSGVDEYTQKVFKETNSNG